MSRLEKASTSKRALVGVCREQYVPDVQLRALSACVLFLCCSCEQQLVNVVLLSACNFNFCHLVTCGVTNVFLCCRNLLGDRRGCMSLVRLRKIKVIFFMCTRIKYRRDAACSAARSRVGAHLVASGRMPADTHIHTQHRDPRAYYMSKYASTRARCTYTAAAHTSDSRSSVPVPALARDAGDPLARSARSPVPPVRRAPS